MKDTNIIVSENNHPLWKSIIAALLFTIAVFLIIAEFYFFEWSNEYVRDFAKNGLYPIIFLIISGMGFGSQKRVYIDLKQSKFKPSIEIGFLKMGKWKTINNYEYVSIFFDPSKNEQEQFEVNLWYDRNKHFELYARNNFEDAIVVGYEISEQLDIDLLDATIANDQKWINKEELKQNK